jgi:hypothetical protein
MSSKFLNENDSELVNLTSLVEKNNFIINNKVKEFENSSNNKNLVLEQMLYNNECVLQDTIKYLTFLQENYLVKENFNKEDYKNNSNLEILNQNLLLGKY